MAKIRDDLEGSVTLNDGTVLLAGDDVPEGVTVGEHVLADEKPVEDEKPKRTSRRKAADSEEE